MLRSHAEKDNTVSTLEQPLPIAGVSLPDGREPWFAGALPQASRENTAPAAAAVSWMSVRFVGLQRPEESREGS